MGEISLYDGTSGHTAPPAQRYIYKLDAPLAEFAWEPRENRLVERVAEARAAGMSYGRYMAKLYEEEVRANAGR